MPAGKQNKENREEPMKYKIEKNTVQETLILPLYSRKLCTELYPNLYRDETAVRLLDQIDYDFSQIWSRQDLCAKLLVPSRFMRKIVCRLRLNEVSRQ